MSTDLGASTRPSTPTGGTPAWPGLQTEPATCGRARCQRRDRLTIAGLVVGVAGATNDRGAILLAGPAGLVAGALSMAGGEYVSVSTQSDTEKAAIRLEKWELERRPEEELAELQALYVQKGLSTSFAEQVAHELTEHDALAAHAEAELGIDPTERTNPHHAG